MSGTRAGGIALRLQGIRKSLDSLRITYKAKPETLWKIRIIHLVANRLATLAPEEINIGALSGLEELIRNVDTLVSSNQRERQPDVRDITKRLRDAERGLNAILVVYKDDPEALETILAARKVVDHWLTLPPRNVDSLKLSGLEELIHNTNAPADAMDLHEQGLDYAEKFQRGRDFRDLDRAITTLERAVELTPRGHPNMATHLFNLRISLMARFELLESLADLDAAISRNRNAVELTPDSLPSKPKYLNYLVNALRIRFARHDSFADLDEAIFQARKAVELTPDGHPMKPNFLTNLGVVLETRFDRRGALIDLEEAIMYERKAVKSTPDSHSGKSEYLSNLGNALETRFQRYGSLEDLEDALLQQRRAVTLTPDVHPNKPGYLNNLGNALRSRFSRQGSLADLEEAVLQMRKAVNLTPDGHPAKPGRLNNLASTLERRFDQHRSFADLEEAIFKRQEAVDSTPDHRPEKPGFLNNLGAALEMRFIRQGSLPDLERAILQKRMAVNLTPDGHPNQPMYLNNLGNALAKRFDRHSSLADLEEAILLQRKAIKLTPDGHLGKPQYLQNLGNALLQKFRQDDALPDLDDSILQRRRAIHILPGNHLDRAGFLNNLSQALVMRFERLGEPNDLQDALLAAQESAESAVASSTRRLQGALSWAGCCILGSTSPRPAFECAIKLLPRMAWLGLSVDDQYFLLAESGSATRAAVEAAIAEEQYATAVEWAEQGRSVVWQNLLSLRIPLEELRNRYPELASSLQEVSKHLEQPVETLSTLGEPQPSDTTRDPIILATERDRLIEEVRSKPGFGNFLKPRSFDELTPAARDGPVAFLNLGEIRCDALVLLADDNGVVRVVPIPLERVTHQKAEQLSEKLVKLLSKSGVRARDLRKHKTQGVSYDKDSTFKEILQTLWLDYVKPILDGLAYRVNLESPPRLWWCTTGPLAFLPLHAAGMYDLKEAGHKTSDYVVSSYTPTLTALLEEASPVSSDELKILTVAISNTPGAPLPSTEEEIRTLHHLAANLPVVGLKNEEATKERVLEGLKKSTWIHLACHGEQVGGKPMESGLILHDGKLKLSEIVKTSLPKADLAFLSACQTAVGDGGVPEESAHLAAGMLFAGYRGVVATMWSIQDDIAPRVAEDFYRYMFRNGKPDRLDAAYALHKAVRSLWESGAPFTSWVPFIHVGR